MTVKELILRLLDQPLDKHVLFWVDYEDFNSSIIKKIESESKGYYAEKYPNCVYIELE